MKLHPKIQEIKSRAGHFEQRAIAVNEFGELVNTYKDDLAEGIINGYGVRWGIPNDYREVFLKGAFSKSIRENGPGANTNYEIKFLNQHNQGDPLSLFETLQEDDYGLKFRTAPLDEKDIDQSTAASVLRKLRKRTLNNFSIGFDYVWDQMEYDEKNDWIVIKEAKLFEISVVSIPADMGTFALRSKEDVEELYDDTEEFIKSLPRKFQLRARQLFANHKPLVNEGPQTHESNAPEVVEPVKVGIDYQYLINNLKLF